MAAVSAIPKGLIQEPTGSKVKIPLNTTNSSVLIPAASESVTIPPLSNTFSLSKARLPEIPLTTTPVNSAATIVKKFISNEINYALDLGISTCSRFQYGFLKAVRSLEKGKPNLYSAIYAGYGFSSFFGMALLPKVGAGILFQEPAFAGDLLAQTLRAESLNAAVFFTVPFCLNLIGKFKFLESDRVSVNVKGFKIAPADFTKVVSIIGVGLSSFSMLFVLCTKDLLKAAKNKDFIKEK